MRTLPPSGVRGGDEFVAAYVRALKALQAELGRLAEGADSLPMVTADSVTFRQEGSSGAYSEVTTGAGGFASLNEVGIRVAAVSGGTALLRISGPQ